MRSELARQSNQSRQATSTNLTGSTKVNRRLLSKTHKHQEVGVGLKSTVIDRACGFTINDDNDLKDIDQILY
jgi:hypothetical protein